VPHYGLTLLRGDHEERSDLVTEADVGPGDFVEYRGERWIVEAVEPSELGRFEAWLLCSPAPDEPVGHD
jgi:hypothetical protein